MRDEEPDSVVLRYLRGIDGELDSLRGDVRELKSRVSGVETGLNAVCHDLVALAEADVRQQLSMD